VAGAGHREDFATGGGRAASAAGTGPAARAIGGLTVVARAMGAVGSAAEAAAGERVLTEEGAVEPEEGVGAVAGGVGEVFGRVRTEGGMGPITCGGDCAHEKRSRKWNVCLREREVKMRTFGPWEMRTYWPIRRRRRSGDSESFGPITTSCCGTCTK
jgi:hypothetical protein